MRLELEEQTQSKLLINTGFYVYYVVSSVGFPGGSVGKESSCNAGDTGRCRFDPWVAKIPWRRAWQPTPVFLPGESPWTEEPVGYSP